MWTTEDACVGTKNSWSVEYLNSADGVFGFTTVFRPAIFMNLEETGCFSPAPNLVGKWRLFCLKSITCTLVQAGRFLAATGYVAP